MRLSSVFKMCFLCSSIILLAACGSGGGGGGGDTPAPSTSAPTTPAESAALVTFTRNTAFVTNYFQQLNSTRPEFRFGVYSSRILLNPNIFVYLKADHDIINDLELLDGSLELFETPSSQMESDFTLKQTATERFDFQDVDLNTHVIISNREAYPEKYAYLDFFDDRMQTAMFSLKTHHITELEFVELQYLQILTGLEKNINFANFASADSMAIIYTQDEHAYISSGTAIYDMTGSEIAVSALGKVQFISNLTETWYPHYSETCEVTSTLHTLVSEVLAAQADFTLPLSADETAITNILKSTLQQAPVTTFENTRLRQMAASMFTSNVILSSPILQHLSILYDPAIDIDIDALLVDTNIVYRESLLYASYLSPVADYMSHFVDTTEYNQLSLHPVSSSTHLWGAPYSIYTIDQSSRQLLGNCVHFAQYAAAALEVANHDWRRIRSWGHEHVYDITSGAIYNNNLYSAPTSNVYVENWAIPTNGLCGIQDTFSWRQFNMLFTDADTFDHLFEYGTMSYDIAHNLMNELYDLSVDKPLLAKLVGEILPNSSFQTVGFEWDEGWTFLDNIDEAKSTIIDIMYPEEP